MPIAINHVPAVNSCVAFREKRPAEKVIMFTSVVLLGLLCAPAAALVASQRSENPAFMMISGVSASTEMCLTVENGAAS